MHGLTHPLARLTKVLRARALETEYGLFIVADCEDRTDRMARCSLAREEIIDERIDNLPLGSIGILRFVDKDVVEAAIKLVADPVSGNLSAEQLRSTLDQIVEI